MRTNDEVIKDILEEAKAHGGVRRISCTGYRNNVNVSYEDGYWNSWATFSSSYQDHQILGQTLKQLAAPTVMKWWNHR